LLTVKLRYKKAKSDASELIEVPVKNETVPFAKSSSDTQFAAAVAGYAMVMMESKFKGHFDLIKVQELAAKNISVDDKKDNNRAEFVELVKKTRALKDRELMGSDGKGSAPNRGSNFGNDGDEIVEE
ncbi:MAG: DUF3520 domain-containing protein, partial [Bdellovibrionaceae bacterium]|nr:DUF3520 domain-containing protein [Pseudobdellovibrionaceae bacterium]